MSETDGAAQMDRRHKEAGCCTPGLEHVAVNRFPPKTFIHSDYYYTAWRYAFQHKIEPWSYLSGPEDLNRARSFHLIVMAPLSQGIEYAVTHARASGGTVTIEYVEET